MNRSLWLTSFSTTSSVSPQTTQPSSVDISLLEQAVQVVGSASSRISPASQSLHSPAITFWLGLQSLHTRTPSSPVSMYCIGPQVSQAFSVATSPSGHTLQDRIPVVSSCSTTSLMPHVAHVFPTENDQIEMFKNAADSPIAVSSRHVMHPFGVEIWFASQALHFVESSSSRTKPGSQSVQTLSTTIWLRLHVRQDRKPSLLAIVMNSILAHDLHWLSTLTFKDFYLSDKE